jgi:hypothetical protein
MPAPSLPLLVAAGLLAGGAVGVGLERAGVVSPLDEPEAVPVAAVVRERVPVLRCPEGAVVAALASGDEVLATGRSDDGVWVEIRSPVDLRRFAWMAAATLDVDGDVEDLEVVACPRSDETATSTTGTTAPGDTTSSSATSSSSTTSTSTTVPTSASTTRPPGTTTPVVPTTPTTAPPPTLPPDAPPFLSSPEASPDEVWETSGCPSTVTLSVDASDDVGVVSVTYSWRVSGAGGGSGAGSLNRNGNTWFGSFQVPQSAVPSGQGMRRLTVTFVATDTAGAQSTPRSAPSIDVWDSGSCLL